MMIKIISHALCICVSVLVAGQALAETELERSNRILKEVGDSVANQQRPSAPNLASIPQPSAKLSPADMAKQFSQSPVNKSLPVVPELMVFVSFAMPHESLVRTVEQSERTGAKLIFRGFAGDKFSEMSTRVAELVGHHRVEVLIHPPAFAQYKIVQVPALVLSLPEANNQLDNGCAQPGRYIKVEGDVGQDYALDFIERSSTKWATLASRFNARLKGAL